MISASALNCRDSDAEDDLEISSDQSVMDACRMRLVVSPSHGAQPSDSCKAGVLANVAAILFEVINVSSDNLHPTNYITSH